MVKTCFKCREAKPLTDYYAHPKMADGHLNKCKACTRKDSEDRIKFKRANDPEWVMREAERQRTKAKASYDVLPQVHRARNMVRRLNRDKSYHWHHWSYQPGHETDVIKLTPQEHRRAHRYMVFDQEHLQYRRCDTMELLDTRERHEAFLNDYVSNKPL